MTVKLVNHVTAVTPPPPRGGNKYIKWIKSIYIGHINTVYLSVMPTHSG